MKIIYSKYCIQTWLLQVEEMAPVAAAAAAAALAAAAAATAAAAAAPAAVEGRLAPP